MIPPPLPLPPILDATCGSRMIHFDKNCPDVLFCDKRECDGKAIWKGESHGRPSVRHLDVHPDRIVDFTSMPFPDEPFWLVVFDDADCLVAAFFHEVGHIIDGRKGFHRNHRVSVFERELRAWTFGLEEMHKFGIGTDAKAIGYMMHRLSRYAAKEGGDNA